ncbi:MAG TPA: alpha-amylase/4-alpha-glucanotransferase domain-containing protein [Candidatus Kapabacteria bacterium]|nr:alpha-amylase/4-alpha-glucanotransferase domain-containing protein [Candidatus Kapabacteria bacterium]
MKSVIFCFNTHNHQPIGNFDNIIEEAYQHSYKPFFDIAERYPKVRFGTHFTGILLDWLEAKHPEYLDRLRGLGASGQLEMISGGFYEPILSVIPARDQQAQIAKLNERIRTRFDQEPTGMWLAERVWEQRLAGVLNDAGIKYIFLDDTHFVAAGLAEKDLTGYYLTEDEGKTLAVFPISKELRYTIPFATVDETIKVLRDMASQRGNNVVCFADDGEKFGVWPKTFEHVYGEGWLEEFFAKLSENSSWINIQHGSEIVKHVPPVGRIYLPNASYAEMMHWALPTAEANQYYEDFEHALKEDEEKWGKYMQFVRGGYWRNFFAKYPEANHLHKHMLKTSQRMEAEKLDGAAYDSLLAAQCNDPYWHGVFGGTYLNNLRHANYTELLKADAALYEKTSPGAITLFEGDFNCDGRDELIVETEKLAVTFDQSHGGMITELAIKPMNFNVLNIVSRQEEAYHAKITKAGAPDDGKGSKSIHDMVLTKEEGLEKLLIYDWYRHGSLIDHFLGHGTTIEDARSMKYEEQGDFIHTVTAPTHTQSEDSIEVRFERAGTLTQQATAQPLRFMKSVRMERSTSDLEVTYRFTNESAQPLGLRFAPEWTFNLLAGDAHDRYYSIRGQKLPDPQMRSIGEVLGEQELDLIDEYLKLRINLTFPEASGFWRFPIETVSLSEAGFERVYQGSIIWPLYDLVLQPGESRERKLSVNFLLL